MKPYYKVTLLCLVFWQNAGLGPEQCNFWRIYGCSQCHGKVRVTHIPKGGFQWIVFVKKCISLCVQTGTWHYRTCPFLWVIFFKPIETPQRRQTKLYRKLVLICSTIESQENRWWQDITDSFCMHICRSRPFYTGTIRDSVQRVRKCVIYSMDWRPLALNRFAWIHSSYLPL